jgi:hypothetical protein
MFNNKSVDFFESQFQRQVREQEYALNPFEILALEAQSLILDAGHDSSKERKHYLKEEHSSGIGHKQ